MYVLISNDYRALRGHVQPLFFVLVPLLPGGMCCIVKAVMRCCSCCLRENAAKRSTITDARYIYW